jgi:hypothetical protein
MFSYCRFQSCTDKYTRAQSPTVRELKSVLLFSVQIYVCYYKFQTVSCGSMFESMSCYGTLVRVRVVLLKVRFLILQRCVRSHVLLCSKSMSCYYRFQLQSVRSSGPCPAAVVRGSCHTILGRLWPATVYCMFASATCYCRFSYVTCFTVHFRFVSVTCFCRFASVTTWYCRFTSVTCHCRFASVTCYCRFASVTCYCRFASVTCYCRFALVTCFSRIQLQYALRRNTNCLFCSIYTIRNADGVLLSLLM